MKLTKYVHSCLLVETPEATAIFDPGDWSWESGVFNIEDIKQLDEIVITHEHADHFHLPFVRALLEKFPDAKVISTPPVAAALKNENIEAYCVSTENTEAFDCGPHAPLQPLGQAPEHMSVHFRDRLTVVGDRHDLTECKEILAYPIVAPWGSVVAGAEMVLRLKPKVVVPLHDWHWHDTAREQMYVRLEAFFGQQGIRFVKPADGVSLEI